MSTCCDESPLVQIQDCYDFPRECLTLSNYGSACGCCGETFITADLSGLSKKGSCTQLKISDDTSEGKPRPGFALKFKIGCIDHSISFCKLPLTAKDWASFIYTVMATDGVLLTQNVKVSIVSSEPGVLTLKVCGDCDVRIDGVTPLATGLTIESSPIVNGAIVPKLGQFVAYSFTGSKISGIQTYNPDTDVYAGFLNLPKSVPLTECCLPSDCACDAVGSCRTIQRTGKVRVALALPVEAPTSPVSLWVKTTGEIVASGEAPSGYKALPYPNSIVWDETTIGSTLITVILH